MTKTIKEINDFIKKLDDNNFNEDYCDYMSDFLDDDFLEELDQDDPEKCFDDIYNQLEENGFFNIEIIYHYKAIKYLQENDQSLQESIEIASEYGYNIEDVTSELLASLLASREAREVFDDLRDDFINFFQE
jgi:hypothetical protein